MLWLLGKVLHRINPLFFLCILLSALFFSFSGICARNEVLASADAAVLEELSKWHKVLLKKTPQSRSEDSLNSESVGLSISKFILYDINTNGIMADSLRDDAVIQLRDKVSIVAVGDPSEVGSVKFSVDGQQVYVSNNKPYAIAGFSGNSEIVLNPLELSLGTHTVTATPYSETDAGGQVGKPFSVIVNIVNNHDRLIPTIPTQLGAGVEGSSVRLSWNDNGTEENGFEIERKEADSNYKLISIAEKNATFYTDKTPEEGKAFYYRIRAVNTYGKSGYSNEVKVSIQESINTLPTATFTIDNKSGTFPLKVKLDASDAHDVDGTIVSYNWDFGDGNEGAGKVITHTYKAEGKYQAALTVIDERNGNASVAKEIIVLSTEEILGTTYYVSHSDGNDDNEGTSADQPWKTLQKVNDTEFSSGDVILFKRGDVWSENLKIASSGEVNGYIQFAAYGDGDKPVFAPAYAPEVINIEEASYVSVKDIHVIAEANEKGIRIAGDAAYAIINSCLVEGNASNTSTRGIEYSALSNGEYPTYPTITNCEVYNFQEGIGGYAGLHEGGYIAENYVHTTTTEGTDLIRAISGDYEGLIISNNELTGWKDDAIDLYGGSNVIIEHNHIYLPSGTSDESGSRMGIKAGGVGSPQSTGNIIRYNKIHHLNGITEAVYDGINTNNGEHGKIYGNLIYAVQGHAIAITSGHDFWRVYHNTAISTKKSGVYVEDDVENIELINNIIGGEAFDIEVDGANAIVNGYHNLLINRQEKENPIGGEGIYESITDINRADTNGLLFYDEEKEDFRLVENGPAVDAGISVENYNKDIQNKDIQDLSDIGAYEYQEETIIVLEPPFDVQANAFSENAVELTWSAANLDIEFVIERVTVSESDFVVIDTISATNYIDTEVQSGIRYFYRIKAIHLLTSSDYSSIVSIKLDSQTNPENNVPPIAAFTTNINEGTIPLEVSFDATASTDEDGEIISHHWDFGDGNTSSGKQTTHTFHEVGEYTVLLTVTDDQDSASTASQVITVTLPENQLPIAEAGEDQTITLPVNELTLHGEGSDPDGEIQSYQWTLERGPNSIEIGNPEAPVAQIEGLIAGEYLFQLTVIDDRGDSSTDVVKVFVNEEVKENQLPEAYAGEDRIITLPADTIMLAGSGSDMDGNITAYQWSYEGMDEFQLDGENSPIVTVSGLTMGLHHFIFTVTDNEGAIATDDVEVLVKSSLNIIEANKAFSPNGDGIDDTWVIENIEAIEDCKLSIFNRAGQQIFKASPYQNNWDATLNGQPLPSTDYYYIIQCDDKKVKSGGIRVLR